MNEKVPKDLTDREYALNILECKMGWPGKGNVEMMMDCLRAIGKARSLSPYKSYLYLDRAINLAKAQGVEVNRFWFQEGEYMNMRPAEQEKLNPVVYHDEHCQDCDGTGWKRKTLQPVTVTRCHCWNPVKPHEPEKATIGQSMDLKALADRKSMAGGASEGNS